MPNLCIYICKTKSPTVMALKICERAVISLEFKFKWNPLSLNSYNFLTEKTSIMFCFTIKPIFFQTITFIFPSCMFKTLSLSLYLSICLFIHLYLSIYLSFFSCLLFSFFLSLYKSIDISFSLNFQSINQDTEREEIIHHDFLSKQL